jgi:hypothetical protein
MSVDGKDNEIEREIGRVLEALSGVEAPLGLEGRVLARMAEGRGRRRLGWVPGVAMAAATCGIAAVVWVSLGPGVAVPGMRGSVEQREVSRGPEAAAVSPVNVEGTGARAAAGVDGGVRVVHGPVVLPVKGRELAVRSEAGRNVTAEERLAEEEMRAPSQAEAPRPLTAQERMLLRVAQGRGAEALAKAESADEAQGPLQEGIPEAVVAVKEERRSESGARDVVSVLRAGLFAGMTTGSVAGSTAEDE